MREHWLSARSAAVDRVDGFVLRRMRTLVERANRGAGRCRSEVLSVVAGGLPGLSEREGPVDAPSPVEEPNVVDQFHRYYYDASSTTWQNSTYRGVTTWKNPLDLWIYQEILQAVRPDLVVETGTAYGGSALYLADLCESLGSGHVVTIDLRDRAADVEHPRLTKIIGSSVDSGLRQRVSAMVPPGGSVLVVLDSDHTRDHVLAEMRLWAGMVDPGSYLIVEDTNLNGHPVYPSFGPGPWEAVETFLEESSAFVVDESKHKFLMTWNLRGYLKRVSQ